MPVEFKHIVKVIVNIKNIGNKGKIEWLCFFELGGEILNQIEDWLIMDLSTKSKEIINSFYNLSDRYFEYNRTIPQLYMSKLDFLNNKKNLVHECFDNKLQIVMIFANNIKIKTIITQNYDKVFDYLMRVNSENITVYIMLALQKTEVCFIGAASVIDWHNFNIEILIDAVDLCELTAKSADSQKLVSLSVQYGSSKLIKGDISSRFLDILIFQMPQIIYEIRYNPGYYNFGYGSCYENGSANLYYLYYSDNPVYFNSNTYLTF